MNVLFVCSGNTCRSPLAVAAWNALAQAEEAHSAEHIATSQSGSKEVALDDFAAARDEESQPEESQPEESQRGSLEASSLEVSALELGARFSAPALSAGLAAQVGELAARNAIVVARDWEQDLTRHRARRLNRELVRDAALICTMTTEQSLAVQAHFGLNAQVRSLGEFAAWCDDAHSGARRAEEELLAALLETPRAPDQNADIADPYGGSLEAYRCCAAQIYRAVTGLRIALSRGESKRRSP